MKGRGKGSQFERETCVALSKTITGGLRRDLFWRSAMSGGAATRFNRNRPVGERNLAQMGDISSIAPEGNWLTERYLLECKFHRKVELDAYILDGRGRIAKWVRTMEEQQLVSGLKGILIFKQNFWDVLVLTREPAITKETSTARFRTLLQLSNGYYLTKFSDVLLAIALACAPVRRRPRA